jgi:hypothetical protein
MKCTRRETDQVASGDECKDEINEILGIKSRDEMELKQFEGLINSFLDSHSESSNALRKRMRDELLLCGKTVFSDGEVVKNLGNPELNNNQNQ